MAALLRHGEADVATVAEAVVQAWGLVDRELSPIVGPAGVAALYRRSLYLCSRSQPVLLGAFGPAGSRLDAEPLRAVLHSQEPAAAAQLGAMLLQTFDEILSRMVGPSLTERLLRPARQEISGAAPAEDPQ